MTEPFELSGDLRGARTAGAMAESCGVTRQGFALWAVTPERRAGREVLYRLERVLANRLEADRARLEAPTTPANGEIARLEARKQWLQAQIEAVDIQIDELLLETVEVAAAAAILPALGAAVADELQPVADALVAEFPLLAEHAGLIRRRVDEILAPLRELTL